MSEQARIFKKLLELNEDIESIKQCLRVSESEDAKQVYTSALKYLEKKHSNLMTELYLVGDLNER